MTTNDPTPVRGFAWFVFPDPARDLSLGAQPQLEAGARPAQLWWIEGTEEGIRNPIWGDTYLVVTETPELPRVDQGWNVEPADLTDEFHTEDGQLRLARLLGNRRTPWGIVQQCEFTVGWADAATARSALPPSHFPRHRDWQAG